MNTNHPTVEIFFVFAMTLCKVRVYKEEANFVRTLFGALGIEIIESEAGRTYQETDTRLVLHLVKEAIPKIVERDLLPRVKNATLETFSIKPP